ncbi:MAG: hypothetical protein QOH49_3420 [Acidobacteriota bacterium]|jgi:hypothetical protein|nr:hypothetical protein [Acidobacteriota bacterium]
MSSALAIASVTAVLKDLLDNAVIDHSVSAIVGGPVTVTAQSPGQIKPNDQGVISRQLNLFLYYVAPNTGWSNMGLPSRDARGTSITNPPLALDLYYLLTAYGKEDLEAEILLGYAMQRFHETPVLTRDAIRTALAQPGGPVSGAGILPSALGALSASDLADQVEQIKLTQHPFNVEEASKLWSAFQTNYRPSVAYHISVVLVQSEGVVKSSLPVLRRGVDDRGAVAQPDTNSPFPTLFSVEPASDQIAAVLGGELVVKGQRLDAATVAVVIQNPRLDAPLELTPLAGATAEEVRVLLQIVPATDASVFVAGVYTLSLVLDRGTPEERTTNEVPFALASRLPVPPPVGDPSSIEAVRGADGTVTVTARCRPDVLPTQRVTLVVGESEALAQTRTTRTGTLTFRFRQLPAGDYFVRLRVDGVESLLVNRAASPPSFDATQKVTVPA